MDILFEDSIRRCVGVRCGAPPEFPLSLDEGTVYLLKILHIHCQLGDLRLGLQFLKLVVASFEVCSWLMRNEKASGNSNTKLCVEMR